jgi:hypothetical protein
MKYERIGMLSQARTGCPHVMQREAGLTTDSPRGTRATTTFRKLPQTAPNTAAITAAAGETSTDFSSSTTRR